MNKKLRGIISSITLAFSLFTTITVSAAIYGDVSGDGLVDSADYTLVRKYLIGQGTPSGQNWQQAGDVNLDGVIDSADFTNIRRYLLGIIKELPIGGTTITPTVAPTVTPSAGNQGPAVDSTLLSKCTGSNPIKFHTNLTPGNYDVTVVLGNKSSAGVTSVGAEARRTMIGQVSTAAGTLSTQTFTVNVRDPEGQPTGQGGTGTSGLDLVFSGTAPKLNGIGVAASQNPTMIYLAGDSTVCDQPSAPFTGWGQILPQYFKLGTCVANYADSGENSASFLSNAVLFPAIQKRLKTGDYVFIQLGHNDKTTTAAAYKSNLTSMVTQCKQKGATPVLVMPCVRRLFNSDNKTLNNTALHINGTGANLPNIIKEVATANNIKYIDLTTKSKVLVESLGVEGSKKLFLTKANNGVDDNTHFSEYGATEMTKLVIAGMKEVDLPIIKNLR